MEETQTLDNNFQEEQQNPPKKYSVKDFATKIRQKYKAYNDVDDDKLVKFFIKKYPVYQDKIEFSQVPIVKKKEDTPSQPLATPSPLPLQKDGGKYVLTDYLTNPKAQEQKEDISIVEPKEEPLSIGNVFDDAALSFSLRNTTKEISNTDLRNNAPITVLVPDEEAIAKSKKIDKEYLENGIDPQKVAKLTHGLNFTQEQKDELDYVAKTNPAYFNRHLHHISWTVPFMQEMHKRREEAKLENDPQKAAQIEKAVSDIYKNGQILPYEQSRDVTRNALRGIRTIFDNPEEQQNKFAENAEYNYGQQLIPIKKDGVWYEPNAELNRGKDVAKMFDSGINDVQRIGLNYLEDLHPEQYQSYKGLLVPYKDGDEKNIDLQVGRQEKLMRLEALGLNIKYKAALEEFYKARERGDVESQNTYKEVLDNTQKFSENLIEKYPLVKQLDVEKLAMEVNGRDDLPTTRFAYVLGSAIDKTLKGGWEIISYPFRSEENYQKHLLEVVGDTKQNENITYLPQKYQTIQNFDTEQTEEAKVKFAEINKQDISDEEKNKQIADYIAQNKDAVTRKEIDGGRTNITMASMLYGVSDIAANLAPFVAITALTGGGASASALRAFTSEFSAASLTMFNDELSAASERGEANPMANALRHTFINSAAMAGAGTAGKIREMAMGSKNPAFKAMIANMDDKAIEVTIKKETQSRFKNIYEVAKNKMVQSATSAAKIAPSIQLGGVVNDVMDGKEFDAKEQVKHLGVETFKFTLFGLLTGGIGAMAKKEKPNDVQKYSMLEAGKNSDYFIKNIDTQLQEGKINTEQYNVLKSNIEIAKKVYDNTPMVDANGKALSDSRARDLMFTKFNEVRAVELLKKDIPQALREKTELELQAAKEEAEKIQSGKEPTFEDKFRETFPVLKNSTDKEINESARENATDNPASFIKAFGEEKFNELVKDMPIEDLQSKLDLLIKGNADNKGVEILDNIISEKEKSKGEPENISQPIELSVDNAKVGDKLDTPKGEGTVDRINKNGAIILKMGDGSTMMYTPDLWKGAKEEKQSVKKTEASEVNTVEDAIKKYGEVDNYTFNDMVNDIDGISDNSKISDAVEKYRKSQEEDRKLFGRGDMDAAEKEFIQSLPTQEVKVIEKKNTGTEIEPELGEGRRVVTLSGNTETERQLAIEQRKKETKQTPMTSDRDKILERIGKYNKLSRVQKRSAYGEANSIKLAVDSFNKKHEQKHSITTNRNGDLEFRNNPTEKRPLGRPLKNTLKGEESSIIDNGKPLMERSNDTKKIFNDLLDANVLPVSRRINGEKMSEAEHDATIQDIMDGIPSQRAENYLNSLEKQIREDNFDFGNPDKNARTTLNEALGITVESGEQMTVEAIEKWLKDESELTPENEVLFDNIDNLITHYEQLHESRVGDKVQQSDKTGKGTGSGENKQNEQSKAKDGTDNEKTKVNEEAKNEGTSKSNEPISSKEKSNTKENVGEDLPPTTGEVGKDKVGDNSDLISITHEATDAVAKELGLPEYTEKPETIAEWDAEVNNRLSENPNAIQEMLDKYRNKGKIDKYDQRMMLKYHAALKDRINKNPTSENIKQYNEAKILSDIEGGREVAKSLVARKGVIPVEDDLANFLVQEANSAGVETLPQKVIDELKTKYEADQKVIKDLNARIEKLEQEAADKELTAQAKKTGKTKKTSSDFKEQRKSLKDKLKQQLEDYKNEIGKVGIAYDGGVKSFAITVDMAKTIGEYVKTYLEEGVTKLGDIVTKLHGEIKDIMPDISERDIRDVIAGKYAEKKQTRNEIAAQMRDIKMQQILLDKIEKLEKGESLEKNHVRKQKISEELKKLKEEFKNMGGEKSTDEQKLQSLKTGLKNKIEKLKKDLETGDFMKEPEQKKPLKLDAEAQKLQDEHIRFVKETNLRRAKAEFNNRSKGEKVYDGIMQVLGIKRIVQTAVDLSIPFRQAVTIAFNPRRWDTFGKSFGNMMKSVFSSKKFDRIMYEIHQSKDYQDMLKDKVHFNEMDAVDSNSRNEDFQKSFIYKIPILREPLLASNRAADGFLNTARYDMYMKGKKMLERQGITRDNAPEHYEALGKWVMNITGRGNLIKFLEDSHSGRIIASNTFFGARLMASRFNLLNPVYYSKMPKEVRIEALKDMATFTSMLFATGLAATAAGATVSFDPDDADFLKIKNGNTRYDISGGMVQYVRTFIRLEKMMAQKINPNISKKEKDKYASYALKSTASFFRYKLAPNTSYGLNALEGKDALGKDFDPYDALRIYPMYVDDMITAYKENGAMSFLTVGLPSIFGIGVQTYEPKKSSKKFPLNR